MYSRFSFLLADSAADGAFRCFAPDADVCVSVADVNDVGFVVEEVEDDDDPAEDADEEDEEASESINSSNLTASGVEKSANDF